MKNKNIKKKKSKKTLPDTPYHDKSLQKLFGNKYYAESLFTHSRSPLGFKFKFTKLKKDTTRENCSLLHQDR